MDKHTKELLQALIAGKELQFRSANGWHRTSVPFEYLAGIPHSDIRVKPNIIKIGDMEVPAPEKVVPPIYTAYWVPSTSNRDGISGAMRWSSDPYDLQVLQRGYGTSQQRKR